MKAIEKTITLENKKEPMRLIPFGDVHLGNANCDKKYFKKTLDWILNKPNAYAVGMGDYCDCIVPQDKRFDFKEVDKQFSSDLDNLPMAQVEYMSELLTPLSDAGKLLTLIPGNHEDMFRLRNGVNVMKSLCKPLNIPEGDMMTFLKIKFDQKQFHTSSLVIWMHHGFFAGRKLGGKVNQLTDVATGYIADVYLTGHSHELSAHQIMTIGMAQSGIRTIANKKTFGNTGTFMKTLSQNGGNGYAERKAYNPAKIGVLRFDIYPRDLGKPDVHCRI